MEIATGTAPCPECGKGFLLPVLINNTPQGPVASQLQIVYKCTVCGEEFKY